MQHLEGSGTPVLYTGRTVLKGYFIIPSQLYMFRAIFSPIIRSIWLYLQHLVVFTQVHPFGTSAGSNLG